MNIEYIEGQLDDPSHFTENIFQYYIYMDFTLIIIY
jgi:hypothetical protein